MRTFEVGKHSPLSKKVSCRHSIGIVPYGGSFFRDQVCLIQVPLLRLIQCFVQQSFGNCVRCYRT